MSKKGISPLIATVLILGFTVALAAIIMTWGMGFTRNMQDNTQRTSDQQVTCATDVAFEIKNVCADSTTPGNYKVTISNNGNKNINSFQVRFYRSDDNVTTAPYNFATGGNGIAAFGIESETGASLFTGDQDVYQVEAIPVIQIGPTTVTCSANYDTFGDTDSSTPIPLCA